MKEKPILYFLLGFVVLWLAGGIMFSATKKADSPQVAALRKLAHEKGLRWHIFCAGDDAFFASAFDKRQRQMSITYVEDGGLPWYGATGRTQEEAAVNLYEKIKSSDAIQPDHRPGVQYTHKKPCPPELSGDE